MLVLVIDGGLLVGGVYPEPDPFASLAKMQGRICLGKNKNILEHARQTCGASKNQGAILLERKKQPGARQSDVWGFNKYEVFFFV